MIGKLLNLIALMLAVAWLARVPSWEPAVVAVGLIASLITLEVKSADKSLSFHPNDRSLFFAFQEALATPDIDFFRYHDFGAAFRAEQLRPLRRFAYEWDNAEHEFQDEAIEEQRERLLVLTQHFLDNIGANTESPKDGILRVPKDWCVSRPAHRREVVARLNATADDIYTAHQELVREAKGKIDLTST